MRCSGHPAAKRNASVKQNVRISSFLTVEDEFEDTVTFGRTGVKTKALGADKHSLSSFRRIVPQVALANGVRVTPMLGA